MGIFWSSSYNFAHRIISQIGGSQEVEDEVAESMEAIAVDPVGGPELGGKPVVLAWPNSFPLTYSLLP